MIGLLVRDWWVFLVRGVVAVLFGIIALVRPEVTLTTLLLMFGAFALVDGLFAIVVGVASAATSDRWGALLLEGIVGALAGLAALFWPGMTALVLLYIVAGWSLVTGILAVAAAIRLRREIVNEWMLAISGVLSIILGVVLFAQPEVGILASMWMIGVYAIIFGVALIVLAFRLRKFKTEAGL
jgi:uncharacterized membrane protein HdeD (DUF308 family)